MFGRGKRIWNLFPVYAGRYIRNKMRLKGVVVETQKVESFHMPIYKEQIIPLEMTRRQPLHHNADIVIIAGIVGVFEYTAGGKVDIGNIPAGSDCGGATASG